MKTRTPISPTLTGAWPAPQVITASTIVDRVQGSSVEPGARSNERGGEYAGGGIARGSNENPTVETFSRTAAPSAPSMPGACALTQPGSDGHGQRQPGGAADCTEQPTATTIANSRCTTTAIWKLDGPTLNLFAWWTL
jgi:hypothetical protein